MVNETEKPPKLSNNLYCRKSRIAPSACTEIDRVASRAAPRRHETRLYDSPICLYRSALNYLAVDANMEVASSDDVAFFEVLDPFGRGLDVQFSF